MRKTDGPIDPVGGYRQDPEGGYPFDTGDIFLGVLVFVSVSMASFLVGWSWLQLPGLVITFFFVGLPIWFIVVWRTSKGIMEGELEGDPDRVRRARRLSCVVCALAWAAIGFTFI